MTVVSLSRRLGKIETGTKPPRGVVFMAWGRDDNEVDAEIKAAWQTDTVAPGDLFVRATWPFGANLPPSRWAHDGFGAYDHAQFGRLAELADAYRDWVCESLGTPPAAELTEDFDQDWPSWPHPDVRPQHLNDVFDARLVATALGERLGSPRPSPDQLVPPILDHVILALREIESRALIRGCFGVVERLRAAA